MTFVDQALLDKVNYQVNHQIKYVPETGIDKWQRASQTLSIGTGDCEDYAILKAQMLIEYGVDPDLLTIAVCRTRKSNSNHAVLLVPSRYRKGFFRRQWADCVYVLDNMYDILYRLEETGYIVRKSVNAKTYL